MKIFILFSNISLHFSFQKFKLKVSNPEKPVAPGLCVPAIVEYECTEEEVLKDRIVVTVDGDVIEIPIAA